MSSRAALAAPRAAPGGSLATPAALLAAPCGSPTASCCCLPSALRCPASPRSACCTAMASLRVLAFDHEDRSIQFDMWLDDLQLYLLSDSRDNDSLFDHTSSAAPPPPATADSATHSQWLTRDAAACFAIRNHLPLAECAAACFATVRHCLEDLVSHLCASDARYRAAAPAEFLDRNQPPMFITLYFIVTRLPDSLRSVRDHFLSLDPMVLTVGLLEKHLLASDTRVVAVGAARGTPRTPFFEGCSPSPLAPSYASAAPVDVLGAEDVGAASASAKRRSSKGKGGRGGGGDSGSGGGGSSGGSGGSGGGGSGGSGSGSGGVGGGGGGSGGSGGSGSGGSGGGRTGAQRGGASRCFFRDSTTLTPLPAPVLVKLADPSGGPFVARSSTVLPCLAVPSSSLSSLHLPSFSTDLVSTAALLDSMVTTTTPGGAASGGAEPGGVEPGGAESKGAGFGSAESWGAEPGGAEPEGVERGGVESEGAESRGAEPSGAASYGGPTGALPRVSPRPEPLSLQQLREWLVRRARLRSGAAGAGGPGDTGDTGVGGAGVTTGAGGAGGAAAAGPGDPARPGAAGAGGTSAGGARAGGAGAGGTDVGGAGGGGAGAVDPGADDPGAGGAGARGAGGTGAGGTVRPRLYFSPLIQQTGGLTERREPVSRLASPFRTSRRGPRPHPPPVPGTHAMALRPSSVPLRVPLPAPPESSLPAVPDPEVRALVAESESASPLYVGGECALGTDVLEDKQEDFECLAAAVPRFASMLLAPEGDPDAPDILTPRSYAKAITGPYSSQRQGAMDAKMASWKSTGTYIDEVPPSRANIVDGMWIFWVKWPPGSPPAFKARYVARGFSQRQGVDYFQTFSPTPKMTTLRVLLHVAAQCDYELHSLDFSTAFLQGSLHEEIWLRRPLGFTGSFPAGTQCSLRRPVYGLCQAPREWHDTLRTTLVALGFAPSTANPSMFLRTNTSLPLFYVLVYVNDLVFATADTEALTLVKSELRKRHTCTDLGELRSYLGLEITRDRARRTITLTQSHMVHQVLQRFGFYTSGMGLVLGGRGPVVLIGHANASWVDDLAMQRSSQSYTFSLGSGSVSWRSTRSSLVLSSNCEAEIYAGAMAAQELRWLTYLLTDLGEQPRSPSFCTPPGPLPLGPGPSPLGPSPSTPGPARSFLRATAAAAATTTATAATANAATAATTSAPLSCSYVLCRYGFSPRASLYLLSDSRDRVLLFDHTSGAAPAPPNTADSTTRSQWLTRDAAARLAIRNHLPLAKCAHFGQHRTAQTLYDAVAARYSSPATAALGHLLLPYLFSELSAFATVEDLVSHLHASDARYHATLPAEFLDKNPPPMYITLYFTVTRLPDSLRSDTDHFLSLDPTSLTVNLLEQHLLASEPSAIAVGVARGTPRMPFFEGCSPSPLAPSYASATTVDVLSTEDVGADSASTKHRSNKGKGDRDGGGGSGSGGGGSSGGSGGSGGGGSGGSGGGSGGSGSGGGGSGGSGGSGSGGSGGGKTGAQRGGSGGGQRQRHVSCPYVIRTGDRAGQTCGKAHTQHRCFSRLDVAWRAEFGDKVERPHWAELLRSGVANFDLGYDAILSAMYAFSASAEGDCYRCVPPNPGIAAAALGAIEFVLPGTAPAEALHTFTLDSGASHCFFCDSTTLTPLPAPVPVRLADPSGGPVVARSSIVLPSPAVPVLRLLSNRGGEFSSDLLRDFGRGEGILQTFKLPDSPQQNGIAKCCIGLVMEELRWLTYLLTDLGEQPRLPPALYVDNKAMIALCEEHRLEHRTKHIALRYFLARELQQRGQLHLAYVATRANTADIFTKALSPVARYSSPATTALGRLLLPYLFPELSAFATVEDLVTHIRTSDPRYRAAFLVEFLDRNPPPMYITLYFIVTCLPDSLCQTYML
ncbi:unnamed protein product [Closterium sp. NIES-53]